MIQKNDDLTIVFLIIEWIIYFLGISITNRALQIIKQFVTVCSFKHIITLFQNVFDWFCDGGVIESMTIFAHADIRL